MRIIRATLTGLLVLVIAAVVFTCGMIVGAEWNNGETVNSSPGVTYVGGDHDEARDIRLSNAATIRQLHAEKRATQSHELSDTGDHSHDIETGE